LLLRSNPSDDANGNLSDEDDDEEDDDEHDEDVGGLFDEVGVLAMWAKRISAVFGLEECELFDEFMIDECEVPGFDADAVPGFEELAETLEEILPCEWDVEGLVEWPDECAEKGGFDEYIPAVAGGENNDEFGEKGNPSNKDERLLVEFLLTGDSGGRCQGSGLWYCVCV
jgi:hypothetical protein